MIPSPPGPTAPADPTPAAVPPAAPEAAPKPRAPRWGFWGTTAWAIPVLLAFILGQFAIAVGLVALKGDEADFAAAMRILTFQGEELDVALMERLVMRGDGLALAAFGTLLPVLLVIWGAVRLAGRSLTEYLALVRPRRNDVVIGVYVTFLFAVGVDVVTWLIGRDLIPPSVSEMYTTSRDSGTLIYLLFGTVIAAPLVEELMFRGFLFRGWSQTRFGAVLGTLLTAPLWASLHMQYDLYFMGHVLVIGFMLGWLRARSGSTLLTMGLHALLNAWAMLEVALITEWFK